MSTDEDDKEEYFLRASLLLLKGGGLMSKETLSREVQKAGINLDVLLKTHKGKLKHKFSREQRNKLCLDGGTTCIEQWDLAMLTTVPLTVFKQSLNDDEKNALKCIKYKRDTVYAHTHSSVLSFDDYDDIRKDLEKALHVLSNGLSDNVKDECAKIIQQCTTGPISPSVKAELSKQLKGTEDLVKAVMTKLTDTHKALLDMRNEIMEKLEKMSMNQDRSEKMIKVIYTELTLSGAVNESDDIDFVDEIVTTVINKAKMKVGNNDYPKIHLAVKNILREIENIPDVKILPAEPKCVLLKFECATYTSILQMLRYLESESFLELLKELASAVNTDLPDAKGPFRVDATVTTDCMTELLDELRAETSTRYARSIRMQTKVQTVHGVKHIWSLFDQGGITDTLQKLSEAVFDELKTRITITPSIDVGQVYDALKEADVQSSGSMQESQVAIRDGAHYHEQIAIGSSKHVSPERRNEDSDFKDKDTDFTEKGAIASNYEETDEPYRGLTEVKTYSIKQTSDSGFSSDVASSIDGQSNISEGRDECMPGRFKPLIGTSVHMFGKYDDVKTTVGPIVTLDGYDEKYFITIGPGQIDNRNFTVDGRKEALKILAQIPNDVFVLIGPADCDVSIEPPKKKDIDDIDDITLNRLVHSFVYKVGASTGLTTGIITNSDEEVMSSKKWGNMKYLLVDTFTKEKKSFADAGDGGALVFNRIQQTLSYVGVLIGRSDMGYYVVKPIKDILEGFEECIGRSIALDIPYMDRQVSAILDNE